MGFTVRFRIDVLQHVCQVLSAQVIYLVAVSVILAVSASCLDCFRPPACFGPPGCFAQIKLFRIQGWLLRPAAGLPGWLLPAMPVQLRVPRLVCVGSDFSGLDTGIFALKRLQLPVEVSFCSDTDPHCKNHWKLLTSQNVFSTMPNNESQRMRSLWTYTLVPRHASHGVHREKGKVSKIPGGGC